MTMIALQSGDGEAHQGHGTSPCLNTRDQR